MVSKELLHLPPHTQHSPPRSQGEAQPPPAPPPPLPPPSLPHRLPLSPPLPPSYKPPHATLPLPLYPPQLLRVYDDGHVEFIRFVWAKLDMHEAVQIGHPTDKLMLETHIASLSHRLALL